MRGVQENGQRKQMMGLQWWIDRWRKSSAFMDLTVEEQGAYRNLLDEAWLRGGPLPNNNRVLAKACGDATRWPKLRKTVMKRFVLIDGYWHNDTLDQVLKSVNAHRDRQARYRERQKKWHRK